MNITDIFKILSEEMAIEKFNKAVEGKVSQSALDSLAQKMKKDKYNNAALAILKGIQEADEKHRVVLEKNPTLAYAVLRQMAKNNSSFNAQEVVKQFLSSPGPNTFWRDKYTENKERGEKKEETNFGLSGARIKNLKNYYLIFPRTFYKNLYMIQAEDTYKGWQELKAISDEMAKRDTSGQKDANVNHWCVASSGGDKTFENYKEYGGVFVVIVGKNKDGSPNWNERYLWYKSFFTKEAADKFNNHGPLDYQKDPEVEKILKNISDKIRAGSKQKKRQSTLLALTRNAEQNLTANRRSTSIKKKEALITEKATELSKLRKIADASFDKFLIDYIEKEIPEVKDKAKENIVKIFKERGERIEGLKYSCYATKKSKDHSLRLVCAYYTDGKTWRINLRSDKENKVVRFIVQDPYGVDLMDRLRSYIKKEKSLIPVRKTSSFTPPEFYGGGRRIKVLKDKPNYEVLHNNKYAEEFTKEIAAENNSRYSVKDFSFPLDFHVDMKGDYAIVNGKRISYDDPDFIEKVKKDLLSHIRKTIPGFKLDE